MIIAEHLTRRFASGTLAVDDVSFEVPRGEIAGLVGPTGAGKTTLLRMLATVLAPTSGRITVGGLDAFTQSLDIRRRIGYVPEQAPLYRDMRVDEYLAFRAKLKGVPRRKRRGRREDVKGLCGLKELERRLIGQLSRGERQLVALADCLIHNPDLLLLDDPMSALDAARRQAMAAVLTGLGRRCTVLLATHNLPDAGRLCHRLLVMDRGRLVAAQAPAAVAGHLGVGPLVVVEAAGPPDAVLDVLRRVPGVEAAGQDASPSGESARGAGWTRFRLDPAPGLEIRPAVAAALAAQGWPARDPVLEPRSLEAALIALMDSSAHRRRGRG